MSAICFLFRTACFNLSKVGQHFKSDGLPAAMQQILRAQPEFEGVRLETKRENEI
jgi:hypothetical protein